MNRLLLLGLNHTTAPLEVRERLAFSALERDEAVAALRQRFPACEFVLLSTCNRVELYAGRATHEHPRIEEMVEFLASTRGVQSQEFQPLLYHKTNREVVEHLFNVTSSLDSMVLGETQILGQVREAYESSCRLLAAGAVLNPLFQRAIGVGRQVRAETSLADGRLSVASVAVDYARQIFERFDDKTVLCIGAGKMAALVLQSFVNLSPGRLLVCNRDPQKAAGLAAKFAGEPVPFEGLSDHLASADVVISSTGSARPILTRAQFESVRKQRRYRPIFVIDIAVPRDVEPNVGELENVFLYNLDDLQKVVAGTQSSRRGAMSAAQEIVARQVEEFLVWHRQREMGPAIRRLYERYHQVAQEELERTLNKLPNVSPDERGHLEELARRIVNKLLHDPVQVLRQADSSHTSAAQYVHAMEKLFQLETEKEE